MKTFSPSLSQLIQALSTIPGIGPKSATRIALNLVYKNREGGQRLVKALDSAVQNIKACSRCRNVSDEEICEICRDERRDGSIMCIVESPADAIAIELAEVFNGLYFVLHGSLSPIDGVEPKDLGMDLLYEQVTAAEVKEVIIATSTSTEGEATAYYITELVKNTGVRVSRIAHGVPVGGQLEYSDVSTIHHAMRGRTVLESN
ncbi:MAG: recombination mediator RecR [Gammaproteobacteria bacterium]|nr:recombination mediator RecR [Gammaproteobacteria bacterium]